MDYVLEEWDQGRSITHIELWVVVNAHEVDWEAVLTLSLIVQILYNMLN